MLVHSQIENAHTTRTYMFPVTIRICFPDTQTQTQKINIHISCGGDFSSHPTQTRLYSYLNLPDFTSPSSPNSNYILTRLAFSTHLIAALLL